VLENAAAGPLDLLISWPVKLGTLELIASRQCPISLLTMLNTMDMDIDWDRFQNFNLDSLEHLRPGSLGDYDMDHFLDLPLHSKCKELTLELESNSEASIYEFFDHPLLQRVERMIFHTRECSLHVFS
jgi:hypothetical protein